jgi:hypothetical protein
MKTWHFYDPATGLFTGHRLAATSDSIVEKSTPSGQAAFQFDGQLDWRSTKIVDGKLVDYQPPAPSADHEWNAETKRWQLIAAASERQARRANAHSRIASLEASQPRILREHALGIAAAAERLLAIEKEISSLRADLA